MEKLKASELKLKDIVWAKAKGNPWWPGIIKKISFYNIPKNNHIIKEKIFTIDFIGEKSHVKLTKENIELFLDNYKKHLSAKQPSLIKSIKLAKKMCDKKNSRKIINLEENISDNMYGIKEQNNKEKEIINKINNSKKGKKKVKIYQGAIESEYDSDDEMSYEDYKNKETKNKKIYANNKFSQIDEQHQHNNKKIINEKNEKNEKDDNNIKINININLTNNNNTFNLFGLQNISKLSNNIKKNNNEEINLINNTINKINEEKDIKNDDTFPSLLMPKLFNLDVKKQFDEQNNDTLYKANNNEKEIICTNELICELTQRLVNYQINLSNSINHQAIIDELENFHKILKNSLVKEQNPKEIDFMNKDLLSVLLDFKLNKNKEIKQKATNIFNILTEFIIKDIFIFNEDETNDIKEANNKINNNSNSDTFFDNEYNIGLKLCELINQNSSNISLLNKKIKKKNINNSIIARYNESSSDSDILDNNNINYEINEELYKIICYLKTDKTIDEFNNLTENFYKNEYNKKNNGLDLINSIKRKKICIKMFNLLRKIFPKKDEILLKKLIIYVEYRIRNEDKTLGKKYYKIINNLFNKIKSLL